MVRLSFPSCLVSFSFSFFFVSFSSHSCSGMSARIDLLVPLRIACCCFIARELAGRECRHPLMVRFLCVFIFADPPSFLSVPALPHDFASTRTFSSSAAYILPQPLSSPPFQFCFFFVDFDFLLGIIIFMCSKKVSTTSSFQNSSKFHGMPSRDAASSQSVSTVPASVFLFLFIMICHCSQLYLSLLCINLLRFDFISFHFVSISLVSASISFAADLLLALIFVSLFFLLH